MKPRTNLDLSVCDLDKVVQSKYWISMMVMEKVMATNEMIKCSNLEKKKEKNKNLGDQGRGIK